MKYIGDLLKISLVVIVFYLISAAWGVRGTISDFNKNSSLIAAQKIEKTKIEIQNLIQQNQFLEACMQAAAEVRAENIFAYSIQVPDMDCSKNKEFITAIQNQFVPDQLQYFTNNSGKQFTALKLTTNQIEWVIVNKRDAESTFFNLFKNQESFRTALTKDIFSVLQIMLIIIFIFSILLVENLQKQLRRQGRRSYWLELSNTLFGWLRPKYIKMAISASEAVLIHNDNLRTMLDRSRLSLSSTIYKMIQDNNLQLPYHFSGTVVGVDINGFSKLTGKYNELAEVLTEKIIDMGMELVMRYGGLFSSVAGDEVVVVFDHEHQAMNKKYNLQMLGAAFARDLMRDYSNHVFHFLGSDHQFNLKAGIADSEITFKETKAGTIFGGEAFTFSKRLSSSVVTENINAMAILAADIDHIKYLVTPEPLETFKFKNMGEHKGYQIRNFLNIESAYQQHPELLTYFRSDTDIVFLVTKICVETSIEKLNLIFQYLSEIKTYHVSESVINSWLNSVKNMYSNNKINNFNKNFARLIILGKNLLPQKQWSQSMTDAVLNIPRDIDGRINASVIELLVDKNLYETVIPISESFLIASDTSFRGKAELLIAKATLELSETVLTEIIEMLQSYNKLQMASGIYVSGQILKYYEEKNPAGLRTYSGYKKIMRELKQIHLKKSDQLSDRMKNVLLTILQ